MLSMASLRAQRLVTAYPDLSLHWSRQSLGDLLAALRDRTLAVTLTANICVHDDSYVDFGPLSQRVLYTPNAGGPSIVSEALSAEIVGRLVGIRRIFTECELTYNNSTRSSASPITDYGCHLDFSNGGLGVSVTRAMGHYSQYRHHRLTAQQARRIVKKKLKGILESSATVANCTFLRQILHIWVRDGSDMAIVRRVCSRMPPALKSNTIILITTVNMPSVFMS
ncbi:hypothetical protein BX666DRAFT_1884376 [Dichotomocladium elegans]|nr:hypothetical protein BX666DRAFT_1884376 [Dichotomocladium elegans]